MAVDHNAYHHTDRSGDILRIDPTPKGVMVRAKDLEDGDFVEVAVHTEDLPRLINALVTMLGDKL